MLKPSKDFGPKKDVSIMLTLDTISRNQCQNVPAISLVFGSRMELSDAATYVLAADANRLWKFSWPAPVSIKPGTNAASLDYLEITKVKGDGAIEIRLKPASERFETIELLLHFEPRGKKNPGASLVLDPVINPGGGPRV